ncbi:HflC protein [Syntrophotalea carbinolica DSM 2380]|uniref:Protein HflC n=1 Tax=Syntrophotalea carbinolica (strain DSM 2380 / NBRC 103641 / GraBd1) TaxID=338963 RepID=Q3A2A5_SYNC1|nr:protease modulator HflC [Syntrophotalea carbinolica]ABA89502.1 HflC protein [Syntrophotalea carbinolica DSM 2380]
MKKPIFMLVFILFVIAFLQSPLFVVEEGEQALVTQFGKPVSDVLGPGLHLKIPFIQTVHRFEKRILKWDGDPNQIPTKDKRYIFLDTTARWRIADPLLFFKTVATERGAHSRLDDIIDSVVRDAVSGHLLVELVRGTDYQAPGGETEQIEIEGLPVSPEMLVGREQILSNILEKARASTPEYGIDLIDVQIKRINYVEQVRKRVYERMISERKKVAAQFRSEGEGEKADILGQMDKELKSITSEAYRQAEEIRGRADAEAAGIYAGAYGKDRNFYAFVRSLEAYRKSVGQNGKLVITTDSDFYRYLQKSR